MNDKPRFFNLSGKAPIYQLIASMTIIVSVGASLTFILIIAGLLIFPVDLSVLTRQAELMSAGDLSFMRYLLVVQDISLLFVPSCIILVLINSGPGYTIPELRIPGFRDITLVILLTLSIFPLTTFTGEINSMMHFPSWLSGVENWMTEKEHRADNMIESLISTGTVGIMLLNLFVMAVVPAISEEFIFRGVFQRILADIFRSGHLAVWVTAFLFSAIHFQFFGFLPRFILGLVFGYLYLWSRTLWLPITAHFVNNAFPVILTYAKGLETLTVPDGLPLWKQAIALPVPVAICILILLHFRKSFLTAEGTKSSQLI